jgi:hypothetical protein
MSRAPVPHPPRPRALAEAVRSLARPRLTPLPSPDFARRETPLSIYLDESWPQDDRRTGVLAGIVWAGEGVEEGVLPRIGTHLLRGTPHLNRAGRARVLERQQQAVEALDRLLACPGRCLPFIMPVTVDAGTAPEQYDRLVSACLQVLLGWLLPPEGPPTDVRVCLEQYGGHPCRSTHTDWFRGLLEGVAQRNPARFRRWSLRLVLWEDKEFEYIPYGDLLAYLALEHTPRSQEIGAAFHFRSWPGYVPLSLDLVPRLMRLEDLEASANVGDVLDLAAALGPAPLGRLVLADVKRRTAARTDLQTLLLDELDRRYGSAGRDLDRLRPQFAAACEVVGRPGPEAGFRLRLLDAAVHLQNANHDGDPERAGAVAVAYSRLRGEAAVHDRELAAFVDLNLAVHHADRFEFAWAGRLMEGLRSDPLFAALSPLARGWVHSSLGQYLALQGRRDEADEAFAGALALYAQADLSPARRAREADQTGSYRAINALDAGRPDALERVEAVLGPLVAAAGRLAGEAEPGEAYHYHLLLRTLWFRPDQAAARAAYLAGKEQYLWGRRHPWPLIACYRGLLVWQRGDPADAELVEHCFAGALAAALAEHHGLTLGLIGGMVAAVARCCDPDFGVAGMAEAVLARCKARLPETARAVEVLENILAAPDPSRINEALSALPFYYH